MSFFNKKEEVVEFQFTTYGKELYSKGKFKPEYYAFFDDGVLYDVERASLTEEQNRTQARIKDETIRFRGVKEHSNPDTLERVAEIVPETIDAREVSLFDFDTSFENQLAASSDNSEFAPAWSISALQSQISSASSQLTASSSASRNLPVPQIDIDEDSITYRTVVLEEGQAVDRLGCGDGTIEYPGDDEFSYSFSDGTVLSIEQKQVLLKFAEKNVENLNDNFEFEIYEVSDRSGGLDKIKPLKFFNFQPQVKNGLLVDERDDSDLENLQLIDETFASHYLEIYTDLEINRELICKLDPSRKDDTIFMRRDDSCAEASEEELDLYGELADDNMAEFFDEEECE